MLAYLMFPCALAEPGNASAADHGPVLFMKRLNSLGKVAKVVARTYRLMLFDTHVLKHEAFESMVFARPVNLHGLLAVRL